MLTFVEIFPYACTLPHDDLFSQDRDRPRWKRLEASARVKVPQSSVCEDLARIEENIIKLNAAYSQFQSPSKGSSLILDVVSCITRSDKARERAMLVIADPQPGYIKEVWNLSETKLAQMLIKFVSHKVEQDRFYFIPRHFPSVTLETMLAMQTANTLEGHQTLPVDSKLPCNARDYY